MKWCVPMMVQQKPDAIAESRTSTFLTGALILANGSHSVLVRDMSSVGAQMYTDDGIEGQDACFERAGLFVAARVAWKTNPIVGLKFYRALSDSEAALSFAAAALRMGDPS
jgi:hypothetical protein